MTLKLDDLPVEVAFGEGYVKNEVTVPFDQKRIDFLDELSNCLLSNEEIRAYPDLATFAFWCRRKHLESRKREYEESGSRRGYGLAFHITPGNVPINCAFSFVFGLLAGNSNIVRLPSSRFPQVEMLCSEINKLKAKGNIDTLSECNALIRYKSTSEASKIFSRHSDLRLIWGGDESVAEIRKYPVKPRCMDLVFPDRFSFSVIGIQAIEQCNDAELKDLAQKFYNDTYLFDQDGCSSARVIMWWGRDDKKVRSKFWEHLDSLIQGKYEMTLGLAVERYARLCHDAMSDSAVVNICRHHETVYRVEWDQIPSNAVEMMGRGGYFYEAVTDDLTDVARFGSEKCQTLTYFGVSNEALKNIVLDNGLRGIDRILPVGRALEMDLQWDGYDLVRSMSRVVSVS